MQQFADLVPQETQKQIKEIDKELQQYDNYQIITPEVYISSANDLKLVKAKYKEIDDIRKRITKPLDDSKAQIVAFFKVPLDKLMSIEAKIKSAMLSWQQEQERKRREEESRLAEIQRKEAEKLTKRAEKAEAKGNVDKAEELRQQAEEKELFTPIVESKVEKIVGIQTKTIWKYRITDSNKIPREYLIPDEKILGEAARKYKGILKIDGVEFYSEEVIAAGR